MTTVKSIIPDWEQSKIQYANHELFPNHYRCLIVGTSGDGKSVILLRLLLSQMLDYDVIFLNTPSIHQMEYKILIEALNAGLSPGHIYGLYDKQQQIHDPIFAIKKMARELKCTPKVKVIASADVEKIPVPEELAETARREFALLKPTTTEAADLMPKTIVIIDDAICSSQKAINKLFTYARTCSINVVYLAQDFFATGKQQCRSNTNMWILFRQPVDQVRLIYSRVSKGEMSKEDFTEFCNKCWDKPRNFVLITKTDKGVKYTDGEEVTGAINRRQAILYPQSK